MTMFAYNRLLRTRNTFMAEINLIPSPYQTIIVCILRQITTLTINETLASKGFELF
jgi:hypothetical protein